MVVKRFFSTLNSLLRSRHLDGIKQKVLGGYANRHIRVYLNAHPGVFTYYDVLTLKKDTLIAQFEVPRHRRTEDQVGVKTVIVKVTPTLTHSQHTTPLLTSYSLLLGIRTA